MKRVALLLLAVLALPLAYLLFWPVPIEPVAWQAPPAPERGEPDAAGPALADAERLGRDAGVGPEDVAVDRSGRIYAGYEDGYIRRLAADGSGAETLADTGGRPLGLAWAPDGSLVIADAEQGLLAMREDGSLRTLATAAGGQALGFADDVDVAADGTIYFSDASTKFGYHAVMADILEHGGHGRLLRYELTADETTVLSDGLQFANGVAVGPDERYVLVTETGAYRVKRVWLKGPRAGQTEVFIDNLPGLPDNISYDAERDIFWLALYAPRNPSLDFMADKPWLRKVAFRLPAALQPEPEKLGFVLGLAPSGRIVHNLQDSGADAYAPITSVEAAGDSLYLGSLLQPAIGRLPVPTDD
ncbi:MAG: SMP-30/gluconolactonase/LRE family protein [Salinisphaeraceae bacterium]